MLNGPFVKRLVIHPMNDVRSADIYNVCEDSRYGQYMSANHIAKCILNGLGAMKLHITCLSVELYFCVCFFLLLCLDFLNR